ncbi:sugar-phosphatase [Providencia rettgeri]|uniref:sugar-phosphatase n=1 Tax=Providencia rettgeri TaxID=587 RepID=UPI0010133800|nr:sugar-phosphatase [Providencia rettgeri]RXN73002.1 sugar-phosphatase [Providencia rettgeri]
MSIKLVAIDLDGTLLNSQHQISPAVKDAIKQAQQKGVHIVLASGRPFSGIFPYLKELGLNRSDNYCISNNGSVIHQANDGSHLIENLLDFDDFQYFEELARNIGVHMHALADNCMFTTNRHISHYTVADAYLTNTPLIYSPVNEMDNSLAFTKFMIIDHPEKLEVGISYIPENVFDSYSLIRTSPYFLEISTKTSSKGAALQCICEKLGITPDKVMSIGDQNNDIQMLQYASVSVAMANALEPIQKMAKFVTNTNDENGVAIAINKFINV